MTYDDLKRIAIQCGDDWEHTLGSDKEFLATFARAIEAQVESEVSAKYEDLMFHLEEAIRNEPQPYEVEKAFERIRRME